jgi:hypothetical protein
MDMRARIPHAFLTAIAALLTTGGTASAAQTIGDAQLQPANYQLPACIQQECTYAKSDSQIMTLTVPGQGVIVRWRLGFGGGTPRIFRLRAIARLANTQNFIGAGTGADRTVGGPAGVYVFENERLPVKQGQFLGVDDTKGSFVFRSAHPVVKAHQWLPPLQDAGVPRPDDGSTQERSLQLNADFEFDRDGDGFGDETQDGCPLDATRQVPPCTTGPVNPAGSPPPDPAQGDQRAPIVSSLRLTPTVFRRGRLAARLSARRRIPTGTTIRWRVNEQSRTTLAFTRLLPGRRVGRRCLAPTRARRRRARCTRRVTVRIPLVYTTAAGLHRLRFHGPLTSRRRLAPGRYELAVSAADAAGNRSAPRRARFRMLAEARRRR